MPTNKSQVDELQAPGSLETISRLSSGALVWRGRLDTEVEVTQANRHRASEVSISLSHHTEVTN